MNGEPVLVIKLNGAFEVEVAASARAPMELMKRQDVGLLGIAHYVSDGLGRRHFNLFSKHA